VRLAVLAVCIIVVAVALIPLLRRGRLPTPPGRMSSDELVKDPVCGTYVVRSRAVSGPAGAAARYFCSAECARRFAG
jgi:YHS domain-containing protein